MLRFPFLFKKFPCSNNFNLVLVSTIRSLSTRERIQKERERLLQKEQEFYQTFKETIQNYENDLIEKNQKV